MLFGRDLFQHVFLNIPMGTLPQRAVLQERLIQCDAGQDRLGQRFPLRPGLIPLIFNQRIQSFLLAVKQRISPVRPKFFN